MKSVAHTANHEQGVVPTSSRRKTDEPQNTIHMQNNVKVLSTNLGAINNRSVYQAVRNKIESVIYNVGYSGRPDGNDFDRAFDNMVEVDRSWFNVTNAYDTAHRCAVNHLDSIIARRDLDAELLAASGRVALNLDRLATLVYQVQQELLCPTEYTHISHGDTDAERIELTVSMTKSVALKWILQSRDYDEVHAFFNCVAYADGLNTRVVASDEWSEHALQFVDSVLKMYDVAVRLTINASETGPAFFAWQRNCLANREADPSTFRNVMEWLDDKTDHLAAQEGDFASRDFNDDDNDEDEDEFINS